MSVRRTFAEPNFADAAGRLARLLLRRGDDGRVHRNQFAAAGLRPNLDRAHGLEQVHVQERVGHRRADGQQTMVAQHQETRVAQVGHQPRLLVVAQRDAFIVVIAQARQHEDRLLRQRQHTALLRRHRQAVERVHVQHALRVVACAMHGAVDREAGRVDRVLAVVQLVAMDVDAHQARCGDLVEHQPVRVDQEFVMATRHAGADVGEHQVIPLEKGHQAVGGGQIDPGLPFLGADLVFQARDVQTVSHHVGSPASCS